MPAFIDENFLIDNPTARVLYDRFASGRPIIDYHCHLSPEWIAEDHRFTDLHEVWLSGDHYKWRAMRANGVAEDLISGNASPREKFLAWGGTVPATLRNPLYHWTHMELAEPFGITDRLLNEKTAEGIWEECNARLAEPGFTARGLIERAGVEVVCTTDDPCDDLRHHAKLASGDSFSVLVLPAFRPDKALATHDTDAFNAWVDRLGEASNINVVDFDHFLEALERRAAYFHAHGCRLADHGLESIDAGEFHLESVRHAFALIRSGGALEPRAAANLRSATLLELGIIYDQLGWVQQFHLGALRNQNVRMQAVMGPDSGFDCIGDFSQARMLSMHLDRLDARGHLARTILYNLNPADNEMFATIAGNYADGSVPGKMQYGAAWWFNDQKDGIERQLNALSNMGLLGRFVGMLTDSRSFLSYSRHDYFRRILCSLLGREVEARLLPDDMELVGGLVEDICHRNAREYFQFEKPKARS